MSARLLHSIEDLLIRAFGSAAATNFLYEMGREAGKSSIRVVKNTGFDITSSDQIQKAREEFALFLRLGKAKHFGI